MSCQLASQLPHRTSDVVSTREEGGRSLNIRVFTNRSIIKEVTSFNVTSLSLVINQIVNMMHQTLQIERRRRWEKREVLLDSIQFNSFSRSFRSVHQQSKSKTKSKINSNSFQNQAIKKTALALSKIEESGKRVTRILDWNATMNAGVQAGQNVTKTNLNDGFGWSMAMNENGTRIVLGAPEANTDDGAMLLPCLLWCIYRHGC